MKQETFKTSDTILGATLLTLGYSPIEFDSKQGRVFIIFKLCKDLEADVNKYWSRSLLVEPGTLHQNFKRLRSVIDTQSDGKFGE